MQHQVLEDHVRQLAGVAENSSLFVSAYVDLRDPETARRVLLERARNIARTLPESENVDLQSAVGRIEGYLSRFDHGQSPRYEGLALFAREGDEPFFLDLKFEVPVPTEISCDTVPSIFRLMELKDTYDSYVVMITTEEEARILEVSLGSVTRQLWTERPELRKRVGREWTRRHYQNHRRDRTDQFVKEKTSILERIMSKGNHNHLILAGNAQMAAAVKKQLPKHLREKLLDLVPASAKAGTQDVVAATLAAFVEEEERESIEMAVQLEREIQRGGPLAVAGFQASREALSRGQGDVLILAADYDRTFGDQSERDELVWLAQSSDCKVEVVNDPTALRRLGGVGCLLRYATYTNHDALTLS